MNNKILSLLGLCQRAGLLKSGEFACEKAVKGRKAKLMIIAEEASDNTKSKFISSCKFYNTPYRIYGEKEELGHAIGKGLRATLVILDDGFAKNIVNQIDTLSKN
ncbi:L7Ae/L30e/S12e/Gadd45 family ribosomal protein [Vallitalea okinawensis]|uniref:L7Ae/L30e/S12e/Gadd45 family ribosomal protein n=1 Tax=Vallitalea okinawensis TaxID=2078660 RepID=UPI000CFB0F78|nr:ribosomal L7Ae/L30e/S12e/Gadd45 family protein [Vallitalea okinawensis]